MAELARRRIVTGQGDPADKERFQCPFCRSYEVTRLFIAPLNMDSCECSACRARWEEEAGGGEYRGRAERASVLMQRQRR